MSRTEAAARTDSILTIVRWEYDKENYVALKRLGDGKVRRQTGGRADGIAGQLNINSNVTTRRGDSTEQQSSVLRLRFTICTIHEMPSSLKRHVTHNSSSKRWLSSDDKKYYGENYVQVVLC